MKKAWAERVDITALCLVVQFVPCFLFAVLLADVKAANKCGGRPSYDRHIRFGTGRGKCFLWGPGESDVECCIFCSRRTEEGTSFLASQTVPPAGREPFINVIVNEKSCCCFTQGDVVHGTDGTFYYFE